MLYPALDVSAVDADLLEALLTDFAPTAAEQRDGTVTFFFTDSDSRQRAADAVLAAWPAARVQMRDVDDEDWARRSQANLRAVTVGRVTICPPWDRPQSGASSAPGGPTVLTINPSMGFGTGHHATTRLCLAALQRAPLDGRSVLDVGTGSGVLALAARALGAQKAVGIDNDADAIASARENLDANPTIDRVEFIVGDFRQSRLSPSDVVTANLTGALLIQSAPRLLELVEGDGALIVSGLLRHERDEVVAAFSTAASLDWGEQEDDWAGLSFNRKGSSTV